MDRQRCNEQEIPIGIVQKASSNYQYDSIPLNEEKETTKKIKFFHLHSGILLASAAGISSLISDVIARRLSRYHTSELISYRVMVEIIFLIPILIQQRIEFKFWSHAPLLLLRGVLLSSTFFFRIFSVQSLPLSESIAIIFSTPIITAILGRIFLKYRFTNIKICALATNFVGIILTCHFWSGLDLTRYFGIGSGLLYTLIYSMVNIITKILTLDLPPKLVVFHVTWMRLVTMSLVTEITNNFAIPTIPECSNKYHFYKSEPVLIFFMGIAMLAHSTFEAMGVKLENPSTVAAVKTSIAMPLVILIQIILFNDVPSAVVVVGVILVLLASLLINVDGIVEKLSRESILRRLINRINN